MSLQILHVFLYIGLLFCFARLWARTRFIKKKKKREHVCTTYWHCRCHYIRKKKSMNSLKSNWATAAVCSCLTCEHTSTHCSSVSCHVCCRERGTKPSRCMKCKPLRLHLSMHFSLSFFFTKKEDMNWQTSYFSSFFLRIRFHGIYQHLRSISSMFLTSIIACTFEVIACRRSGLSIKKRKEKKTICVCPPNLPIALFLGNLCSRNFISPPSQSKQQVVNLYNVWQLFWSF